MDKYNSMNFRIGELIYKNLRLLKHGLRDTWILISNVRTNISSRAVSQSYSDAYNRFLSLDIPKSLEICQQVLDKNSNPDELTKAAELASLLNWRY